MVFGFQIIAFDQFTHGNTVSSYHASVRGVFNRIGHSDVQPTSVHSSRRFRLPPPLIRLYSQTRQTVCATQSRVSVVFQNSKGAKAQTIFSVFGVLLIILYYNIIHNIFVDSFRDDGMALAAPGAYVSPRRLAGLPAPAPVKVVATLPDATTTATIVMQRHQRIIEDCFNFE